MILRRTTPLNPTGCCFSCVFPGLQIHSICSFLLYRVTPCCLWLATCSPSFWHPGQCSVALLRAMQFHLLLQTFSHTGLVCVLLFVPDLIFSSSFFRGIYFGKCQSFSCLLLAFISRIAALGVQGFGRVLVLSFF